MSKMNGQNRSYLLKLYFCFQPQSRFKSDTLPFSLFIMEAWFKSESEEPEGNRVNQHDQLTVSS